MNAKEKKMIAENSKLTNDIIELLLQRISSISDEFLMTLPDAEKQRMLEEKSHMIITSNYLSGFKDGTMALGKGDLERYLKSNRDLLEILEEKTKTPSYVG